jgi:hypothetical protein
VAEDAPKVQKVSHASGTIRHPKSEVVRKYTPEDPPRRILRVIDTPRRPGEPPPVPNEEEELKKEIRQLEPAPLRPPKVEEPEGPVGRKVYRKAEPKPERMIMIDSKKNPAHGPCDPAAIFEMRSRLEQIKADVPEHVCGDPYKEADNGLVDLQIGFNRGMAKCQNRYWQSITWQKIKNFHKCIKMNMEGAPHLRPEARRDMLSKLELADYYKQNLLYPFSKKTRPPRPIRKKNQPLTPAEKEELQEIEREIIQQDKEAKENPEGFVKIPPEINVKNKMPLRTPPPEGVVNEMPKDTSETAWTEEGSPPSLIHAGMPVACAFLGMLWEPSDVRRRIAEGFL